MSANMDVGAADGKSSSRPKEAAPDKQARFNPAYNSGDPSGSTSPYPNIPPTPPVASQNANATYGGSFESGSPVSSDPSVQNNPAAASPQPNRIKTPSPNYPADMQPAKTPLEYQRPQYTFPGVLHFLQHEWTRFELDRAQWEVERAELQARVAFLQGERKSQESLKVDLVRRIKMLELALRQERQKFARYKVEMEGAQPVNNDAGKASEEFNHEYGMSDLGYGDYVRDTAEDSSALISGISWKEGRHLLRQYLKEIGYTDTLIHLRSARVRQLVGNANRRVGNPRGANAANATDEQERVKDVPKSVMDNALMSSREAEDSDEGEDDEEEGGSSFTSVFQRDKKSRKTIIPMRPPKSASNEDMAQVIGDADTEAAIKEFDFLGADTEGSGEARSGDGEEWPSSPNLARMKEEFRNEQKDRRGMSRPKRTQLQEMLQNLKQEEDITDLTASNKYSLSFSALPEISFPTGDGGPDGSFGLGELAGLTVNNDTESGNYDLSANRDGSTRKSWSTKYSLRSHFDGVRSLTFHPEDLMLMTASDDGTLKYWNLFRNWNGNKKASSVDFEPVYTFRGHIGPVLSTAMSNSGEYCISGGADSTIRFWNLSCTTGDPYEAYDPAIVGPILEQHTDAVWHLAHHPLQPLMVSCSADGRIIWWNTENNSMLTQMAVSDWGAPTCADIFPNETAKFSASFAHDAAMFDVETGKAVVKLKIPDNPDDYIYRIVNHPSLPIAITAHEDRQVRFFDTNTGELINSMVAHLDAVSSLAVDPNGLYLVTGSHDSSIRFWSMDSKTCLQESSVHRKKLDESVLDVAFHPSKNHVASAGADGVAKVFT
ncbi:striatin-like isoform X2 [Paramacrobiotus metropolitanus]|uniref:striatin-like isoform X2 n=1 Tax=Paramacrobiotus metropolitanus TaxID=2943436 RepID=UPI002445E6B4|nr:striatin-like isoform X2 [Paramacrobiotus metropolitanus]